MENFVRRDGAGNDVGFAAFHAAAAEIEEPFALMLVGELGAGETFLGLGPSLMAATSRIRAPLRAAPHGPARGTIAF